MREGLKLARAIGQTSPLKDILGAEIMPGSTVSTDDDWEAWLRANAATEYHPTASCAMLPKSQGGVVNAKLQVYGTCKPYSNLLCFLVLTKRLKPTSVSLMPLYILSTLRLMYVLSHPQTICCYVYLYITARCTYVWIS